MDRTTWIELDRCIRLGQAWRGDIAAFQVAVSLLSREDASIAEMRLARAYRLEARRANSTDDRARLVWAARHAIATSRTC